MFLVRYMMRQGTRQPRAGTSVHQWATADAAEMESLSTPLMIIAGQDFSCEEAADREMSENQDGFFAAD